MEGTLRNPALGTCIPSLPLEMERVVFKWDSTLKRGQETQTHSGNNNLYSMGLSRRFHEVHWPGRVWD